MLPLPSEILPLSLHDALPICDDNLGEGPDAHGECDESDGPGEGGEAEAVPREDRKSTRLNSSHLVTSYAVFCLKKKNTSCNPRTSPRQRQDFNTVRQGRHRRR